MNEYMRMADRMHDLDNQFEQLKKKNTELKSELTKKADTNHSLVEQMAKLESDFRICEKNADTYYDQLTKAKELLNEFMRISKASDEDFEHDYSELIGDTEQFIKEIEK